VSEAKKIQILTDILGDYYHSGNELLFKCPFCSHHKKKLSVNIAKGAAKCWVCDWSTPNLSRIVKRLGNYSQVQLWNELCGIIEISDYEKIFAEQTEVQEETEIILDLPPEFQSLCNKDHSLSSLPARRYLRERGLTKEDILYWKIGYAVSGEYAGRVIIPSFNMDGKVNYYIGRTYEDNWKKYINPDVRKDLIFNELYVDWSQDVTIVEGVFDAIKAKNAIPILGSTLREGSRTFRELIKNDSAVFIALDPDAEKKADRLIKDLLHYDAEVYKIPIPENIDVGEMSHEQFLECKKKAKLIKNTDYFLINKIMSI
jgi:DNA primase